MGRRVGDVPVSTRYGGVAFGRALRAARRASDITQTDAGALLGWSHAAISDVELGKTRIAALDLATLELYYGTTLQEVR